MVVGTMKRPTQSAYCRFPKQDEEHPCRHRHHRRTTTAGPGHRLRHLRRITTGPVASLRRRVVCLLLLFGCVVGVAECFAAPTSSKCGSVLSPTGRLFWRRLSGVSGRASAAARREPPRHNGRGDGFSTALEEKADADDDATQGSNGGVGRGGGGGAVVEAAEGPGSWPCLDKMDRDLIRISLPVIGNFAINPLIGAVDLFWVNRMGDALAVAGQAAANQVFNSAFWFTSFLPSVTATLVSKKHASGDEQGTQDAICQALFVGFFIALVGSPLMFFNPDKALSAVLAEGAPALAYARPYLLIRSLAFLPSMLSLVGFSAFRGILDTQTPVKISAFANIFNAVLDPILIFMFAMGVPGAALATLAAEVISAAIYMTLLRKRQLVRWRKIVALPSWKSLKPLVEGGLALQLRNLSLNLTFLAVTRVTQSIDTTGVAAAAHAMAIQTFQIGGVVLLALSTVAQIVIPNAMVERTDEGTNEKTGGLEYAKTMSNRMMSWGLILGVILGGVQLMLLPTIKKASPLQEVRDATKLPSIIASVLQIINGLVFIGEGIMIGTGSFLQLSLNTVAATAGCLWALKFFPPRFGLGGVWLGFVIFNFMRLAGVWIHQTRNGPLARRVMDAKLNGT